MTAPVNARTELARLREERAAELVLAFDGAEPSSRPNPVQQSVLEDTETLIFWILGGNRGGKSQTTHRAAAWWFNETHPYMARPAEWGTGPLQILVVGRLGEQMESELWERKIKPFLDPDEYEKPVRVGNILQRVVHKRTRNRIIFLSHHDAIHAREKVQAFSAHVVVLDEMPDHAGLVTELMMRTLSMRGRMYAGFTPLIKNEEIRKIVDTPNPKTRKVQLSMLDNPVFKGREAEVEAQVRAACTSEAEFRARMYGEWYYGDTRVFAYDAARHYREPADYDRGWRHVAVADPSASGLTGLVLWAEDPVDGRWYNVKAVYLNGAAAFELLDSVEAELTGYNVFMRLCDCNPAGFYKEAARRGIPWRPYTEKANRKLETINLVNTLLQTGRLFLTSFSFQLADELVMCAWADTTQDRIVAASKYHLADPTRYFADCMPTFVPGTTVARTETQALRAEWKTKKAAQAKALAARVRVITGRSAWKRRGV